MKIARIILLTSLFAASLFTQALADGTQRVVSIEVGYSYVVYSSALDNVGQHGPMVSLYYGYVISDKPNSMTILSLVLGYNLLFPDDAVSLMHSLIYGLEFEHIFFRQSRVSLLVDYGLLFNQIRIADRSGYAYGHHTKLGVGGVYNFNSKHKLALTANYNFISFPYFDISSNKYHYPSVTLRYLLIF